MAEEFEGQDLSESVFWGVDLRNTMFRDVDMSGVRISHARLIDIDIDAEIDRVVINGVDVTDFVNERDRWYPLRSMVRASEPAAMVEAWDALQDEWATTIDRARGLTDEQRNESVGGEWSFVQTLRHLVFAIDKWFTLPILGEASFASFGMSNSGSADFGWEGVDQHAAPTFDEVLAVRANRAERFRAYLETYDPADADRRIEILENGLEPLLGCLHTVFEEEFEHHRYAVRDLAHFS